MARKLELSKKVEAKKKTTVSTPVRNSAIPKVKPVVLSRPVQLSVEQIAAKAFEIFASGKGGSELDNWYAAERQLRQAA